MLKMILVLRIVMHILDVRQAPLGNRVKKERMNVKGFTLVELLIVVFIVGILGSLGFAQYGRSVERSRGAEAIEVIGAIRGLAIAHWNEFGAFDGSTGNPVFDDTAANIGGANGQIPSAPRSTHYFTYGVRVLSPARINITATRCANSANCKGGVMSTVGSIQLELRMPTAVDTWTIPAAWR